jgi:hypothetical protein
MQLRAATAWASENPNPAIRPREAVLEYEYADAVVDEQRVPQ